LAPQVVSCGVAGGRPFYVAAILGAPALWAHAREAVRRRRFRLALLRARYALSRAFSGSLRFTLDDLRKQKAQALTLMCPLVSRALNDEQALEAAALDPRGAAEAFRLGLSVLFGRWRQDASVRVQLCTFGKAWARGRIPVILDGEPHRLESPVTIQFRAQGFRAFAPPLAVPNIMTVEQALTPGSGQSV
jgi:diacylglycerol kinase family enzyme